MRVKHTDWAGRLRAKVDAAQNPIESALRRALNVGMVDGTVLTIEFISGFELFNTRPFHNYETWGQGWRISGRGVTVERENLDEAVALWIEKYQTCRTNEKT